MNKMESIQDVLNDFKNNVINEAKKNLVKKNTSGELKNSIKANVKESKNSIEITFQMAEYGTYQDLGVSGRRQVRSNTPYSFRNKMPPPSAFDKWVVRKGLAPRNKKGQFKGRSIRSVGFKKSITFLIARSIYNKGIKPSYFFTKPFQKYFKKLPPELLDKFGLELEKLFVQNIQENFKRLNKEK